MKIDGGAQGAYAAYRSAAAASQGADATRQATGAEAAPIQRADRADISAQGRLRAQATDAVRATPETRADLVAELRAQVRAGTYAIDDHKLAARLAQHIDIKA